MTASSRTHGRSLQASLIDDGPPSAEADRETRASWSGPGLAVAIFLTSRICVLGTAKAVTWLFPDLKVLQLLGGWDGGWYQQIAAQGYPETIAQGQGAIGNEWAFFPGYPLLIRGTAEVTGFSYTVSGVIVSTVAGAVFASGLWILVEGRLGHDNARSATTLLCFFPSAYVLGMIYTESVFLALAAVCLVAIERRRWITAGLGAGMAGAVRFSGVALVVVVAFCVAREIWSGRATLRSLAGGLLAPMGIATWMVVQWAHVGSPVAFLRAQEFWFNEFAWFTTPFRSFWRVITQRATLAEPAELMSAGALVLIVVAAALGVWFARRHRGVVPFEWWIYSSVSVVFAFSPYWPTSVLRYTMAAFPLFAVALGSLPQRAHAPLLCVSAAGMTALAYVAFGGMADWQHAPFAP